uniref:Glucuronosyltransferase n=1 Tax=Rhabditophanes sp. KR3021 TaxID=114890 RepID=A0AC35TG93_9BILA
MYQNVPLTKARLLNGVAFTFEGGYSHIGSFMPFAKDLSSNGFNATIFGTNAFPYHNPNKETLRLLTNVIESNKTREYLLPETKPFYDTLGSLDFSTHQIHLGTRCYQCWEHCKNVKNPEMALELDHLYKNESIKEIVYMAFGGSVRSFDAPKNVVDSFVGPKIENAHLFQWANQDAILKDEKTKLFINHGDFKSIKEGLCGGKKMLFMSVFVEQIRDALSGHYLPEKIERTKAIMIDKVMDPLQESAWQAKKFVNQRNKVKFTKRKGINVSWLTHFYGLELSLVIAFVFILWK